MRLTTARLPVIAAVAVLAGAGGCGGGGNAGGSSATPASPASSTAPATTAPVCPNPEGQLCLGKLDAGTYTTKVFIPAITYTVPAGWWNYEDTPGNFLLVPPYGDLPGVNAGTSDYIGIYGSVVAEAYTCTGRDQVTGVLWKPAPVARHLSQQHGLVTTRPRPVQVGGLKGVVLDIRLRHGAGLHCPGYAPRYFPIITGVGRTGLDHGVISHMVMRLYLLQTSGGSVLAVEVDDVTDGRHLDRLSQIVHGLSFSKG
jgi:hypothetical protein